MFLNCAYAFFFPVLVTSKSTGRIFSFFDFSMAQWIETLCSCTIEVRSRCRKVLRGQKCLHQVQQQLHVFQAVATCRSTWYFIYVVSLIYATFVIPALQTRNLKEASMSWLHFTTRKWEGWGSTQESVPDSRPSVSLLQWCQQAFRNLL